MASARRSKTFIAIGPCRTETVLRYVPQEFPVAVWRTLSALPLPLLVRSSMVDKILFSVPHRPEEDTKVRATGMSQRRGGNCPNVLEVLQQLIYYENLGPAATSPETSDDIQQCPRGRNTNLDLFLVSALTHRVCESTTNIIQSFEQDPRIQGWVDIDHCVFRYGRLKLSKSYVIFSEETGNRTTVSYHMLDDLYPQEFSHCVGTINSSHGLEPGRSRGVHFHFEARDPNLIIHCSNDMRTPYHRATISVDIEEPGIPGMEYFGHYVDHAFFSKAWAVKAGYTSAAECVRAEAAKCPLNRFAKAIFCTWGATGAAGCVVTEPHELIVVNRPAWEPPIMNGSIDINMPIVDTNGAGDSWIASMLYTMLYMSNPHINGEMGPMLDFANEVAGRKIRRVGFNGLGLEMRYQIWRDR